MNGEVLYIITSLPAIGSIESLPAIGLREMREVAAQSTSVAALVDAVLVSDDLLQREAFLAGEIDEVSPTVLTTAQVRDQEPLPDHLAGEAQGNGAASRLPADRLWESYFRHAADLAERRHCRLLADWAGYEVGLRNALVRARAKALGLEVGMYLVAEDLASATEDYESVINEWSAASDPLAGLKVLDRARWEWLQRNEHWYSFEIDEVVAYAARLMLVCRWERIRTAESAAPATA